MKIIAILADGFEETEAVTVIDVLRRLDQKVVVAGLAGTEVTGSHGLRFRADSVLGDCSGDRFDAVFLPGGMPGAAALRDSEAVISLVRRVAGEGGVTAAICAAPIVLARAGLLAGKRFTAYPGFESSFHGAVPTGAAAERDGRVVTGRGPGASFAFAAELATALGLEKEVAALYCNMFVELE